MLPQYMTATTTGVYRYRRRTPNELKDYIGTSEIIRSLGRDQGEAISKAVGLNQAIDQSILLVKMNMPSSIFLPLLSSVNLTGIPDAKAITTKGHLSDTSALYLKSLSVSKEEIRDRSYIITELYPALFKIILKTDNPKLSDIQYSHLIKARELLQQFPKRNIERYRQMPLYIIAKGIEDKTLVIPEDERISLTTLNKYIKWFSVLLSFAVKQNLIPFNPTSSGLTIKKTSIARGERKEFTKEELQVIDQAFQNEPIYPIVRILRYTGMRPSELLKCSLSEIEGVLCFDLRSPSKALKTLASHRVIPVHPSIMDCVQNFQELLNSYAEKYITKRFAKVIQRNLNDSQSKSMYSLRHTFATNLIANGVRPEIVSELMGHSHTTMTLNRYVKGFPIATLKSAIETL